MTAFKVVVLTPSTGICRIEYAMALARLVGYFSMIRIADDCPQQSIVADSIVGSSIAANYETLVSKWLKQPGAWSHFLFVEDDMGFEPDTLHVLASRRVPIVGCNYTTNKGNPIKWTAVATADGRRIATHKDSTGLEAAYLVPHGFTLIAREVFERLEKPWFANECRGGKYILQDEYFCEKAGAAGFPIFVDHDASKKIWHIGPHSYCWDEMP